MRPFKLPKKSLGDLDASVVGRLIGTSADVALVVDAKGVIRDLAVEGDVLSKAAAERWIGQPWVDTVTVESRPKILELLEEAGKAQVPRWRQVNHPSTSGDDLPVRYTAIEVAPQGRIVALGRDLRAMAALQQRIVDAQRQMENEYRTLRQSETRYRALFHSTSEAVLIVDPPTLKIVEANPRAGELIGKPVRKIIGRTLLDLLDPASKTESDALRTELRTQPHARPRTVKLAGKGQALTLTVSVIGQDSGASYVIARLSPLDEEKAAGDWDVQRLVAAVPDAFVVIDPDGRVQAANEAFLSFAQLASEDQARGQSLDRWLGRGSADLNILLRNVKEHGSVRRFNSRASGEFGAAVPVEVSAVSALAGNPPSIGLVLRSAEPTVRPEPGTSESVLPRSVDQMMALVGRVPLKELVRETTDIIERMCIEAALELTQQNRASAAEILGLSRQGLYTKLRRYGIGDGDDQDTST